MNSPTLADSIEVKEAAVVNTLVGSLSAFADVPSAVQASTPADFLAVGSGLLPAFTYLYVAGVHWSRWKGPGLPVRGDHCHSAESEFTHHERPAHGRHPADPVKSVVFLFPRLLHDPACEMLPGTLRRGSRYRYLLDIREAHGVGHVVKLRRG